MATITIPFVCFHHKLVHINVTIAVAVPFADGKFAAI